MDGVEEGDDDDDDATQSERDLECFFPNSMEKKKY